MKQLINRLYGITQQGDIFRNDSVQSIEYIAADWWNVWICTRGWGILENSSVESDSRYKYGVNETADK